jgi:hypothetical protein
VPTGLRRAVRFEEFIRGITEAVSRFPGHMRTNVFRPPGARERRVAGDVHLRLPGEPRDCPKRGRSNAPIMNVAGIRRAKWTGKPLLGGPQGYASSHLLICW